MYGIRNRLHLLPKCLPILLNKQKFKKYLRLKIFQTKCSEMQMINFSVYTNISLFSRMNCATRSGSRKKYSVCNVSCPIHF